MAYPTTSIVDDFNRADNSSLGGNWTEGAMGSATTIEIQSNKASVGTTGSGSIAILTSGFTAVSFIACDVLVEGLETSASDGIGLAVAREANVNQGYSCEVSYGGGGDSVFSIYDSNADLVGTVTATGFGSVATSDRIGWTVEDQGSPAVELTVFLKRSGTWNELGSVTTSDAGDYRAGPYLPGMRQKYAPEIYDDFAAADASGGGGGVGGGDVDALLMGAG